MNAIGVHLREEGTQGHTERPQEAEQGWSGAATSQGPQGGVSSSSRRGRREAESWAASCCPPGCAGSDSVAPGCGQQKEQVDITTLSPPLWPGDGPWGTSSAPHFCSSPPVRCSDSWPPQSHLSPGLPTALPGPKPGLLCDPEPVSQQRDKGGTRDGTWKGSRGFRAALFSTPTHRWKVGPRPPPSVPPHKHPGPSPSGSPLASRVPLHPPGQLLLWGHSIPSLLLSGVPGHTCLSLHPFSGLGSGGQLHEALLTDGHPWVFLNGKMKEWG